MLTLSRQFFHNIMTVKVIEGYIITFMFKIILILWYYLKMKHER